MRGFVSVGTAPEGWARQRALQQPGVHLAFGLHPWWVTPGWEDDLAQLDLTGAVALGEVGLDRLRPHLDLQQAAYLRQLELARSADLPVVLHVVKAHDLVGKELRGLRGVVHSYSGSREQMRAYLSLGFHISFAGGCLRGGDKVEKAIRAVPSDRLLVETDSPDQLDEPACLTRVVEYVARLRGETVEQVATDTSENARRLFGL